MTKNMFLDLWREIRRSLNRFLSIMVIVVIGVSVFAGLLCAPRDMAYTIDNYFDEYNTMDFRIISTLGLTDEDISALESLDIVEEVQPGYFVDALALIHGSETVFRINSLPQEGTDGDYINQMELHEGRMPENYDEIVVEYSELIDYGIDVGDTISFYLHDSDITDKGIITETFTVVGTVTTPLYMTPDKETSTIDGLAYNIFAYVPDEAFNIDGYYTEANITIKGAKELNSFDKDYEKLISTAYSEIKNVGTDRSKIRAEELKEISEEQLQQEQEEYDTAKAEFESLVGDAESELIDGYAELKASEAQLEDLDSFSDQMSQAYNEQINESEELLQSTETLLQGAQTQFNLIYQESKAINNLTNQYSDVASQLDSTRTELKNLIDTLSQTEGNQETLSALQSAYDSLGQQYNSIKNLNNQSNSIMDSIDETYNGAQTMFSQFQSQLSESEYQLNQAKSQQLYQEASYAEQQTTGQAEVEKGWTEYENEQAELEAQKIEGQLELDEAAQELIDARIEIEKLESADWYIMDRLSNYGYSSYSSTVDSMKALGTIIPAFFLLVAILVCVTTMTRMVDEHRTIIGVYKALGYGDGAISEKYVIYVMIASVVGGVIGSCAGTIIFPYAMYTAWGALYTQPELIRVPHWGILVSCFVICILAMTGTAYLTTRKILKNVPASLMRPKAPKQGKTVFLEKMKLWRKLSFAQKVTARNILRYKKRLIMTLVGITGCTALLLAATGMNDTLNSIVGNQYGKILRYDLELSFESEDDAADFCDEYIDTYACKSVTTDSMTISNGTHSETVTAYVADDYSDFDTYIRLQERTTGTSLVPVDNGIIITEKLADNLGISVGDYVNVMSQDYVTKSLPVTGITENYVYHYAYMTKVCYEGNYKRVADTNTVLVELGSDAGTDTEKALLKAIRKRPEVTSAYSYTYISDDFEEEIAPIKSIVYVIILSAAILAFVVLYNLTNINISERIKEIATIKVIGYKQREVAGYIYRENAVMTVMGTIIGLAAGIGLHRVVIKSIEQSYLMYGYYISWKAYALSILLTFLFSWLVMVVMYRKIVNTPMAESLKSVE